MEATLRAIFDNAFQLMGVLTTEGMVLDVNRAALDLAGLEREDVIGRPFWETGWWAGTAEVPRLRDAIARAAAGETVRFEAELPTASGLMATIDFSIKPVRDEAGTIVVLLPEGRDVTESKWAERALRVSEAKFAGIISIASDAIISVDSNFEITLFNQGAETIFGYSADEILGQQLNVLLPERFRSHHNQHLRHFAAAPVVARRMGERQEIMGRRRDGTEFPAEASISKLDLFGSTIFTVVLRDISERKRTERAQRFLASAGAILASTLDYEQTLASVAALTVPELADWSVVYIRDEDGSVRRLEVAHADPARRELLRQLMRFPLDPASPHPVFTVLETGRVEVMSDIDVSFRQALSRTHEQLEIYETLGLGSLMMVPLVARGQTLGAMGFFSAAPRHYGAEELHVAQDLAVISALAVENARLYRDAKAAVRARDDMIDIVSHDLGNPLSAIRIGTSLLLRSIPQEEQTTGGWQHLDFIRQSAQQMENLINDLLDVKRLEAGTVSLRLADIDSTAVVRDVLEIFAPIAQARTIELSAESVNGVPRVHAEHQRVVQVLSNLLSNALKFTDPGGTVTLNVRRTDQFVLFTVSDTGRGIAPEHQPYVFDRFWQLRKEGKKGLGLGLAIARGIVEAHGGRIWCESAEGEGTTFLFTLPAANPS
jgi:PAS domain S-box-containing protein